MDLRGGNLESPGSRTEAACGNSMSVRKVGRSRNRSAAEMKEFESRRAGGRSMRMLHKTTSISAIFITLWAGAKETRQAHTQSAEIGYKSAAGAEQNKTLLLKDFKPTAMLHAAAHKVERAKYYVIDVHNHVNDAQGIDNPMLPRRVIEVMDHTNVKTGGILTGMWGEKLQTVLDTLVKPYPGRVIVFCQN